jgi:hypothetical protein
MRIISRITKFIRRLCPSYGNWGAPGWSGGQWISAEEIKKWTPAQVAALWLIPPIDEMDACFKRHDWAYQHPEEGITQWQADLRLVDELSTINPKGIYANAFWYMARKIFYIKGTLQAKSQD